MFLFITFIIHSFRRPICYTIDSLPTQIILADLRSTIYVPDKLIEFNFFFYVFFFSFFSAINTENIINSDGPVCLYLLLT